MKLADIRALRALQSGSIALACSALVACGGGGSSPKGTISGTAATGAALGGASIQLSCKNGSASTTADSSGHFSDTFTFDAPCVLTATSGSTTLHSFASASGTYNITPLTELLLTYIAGQLGTTLDGLVASATSNASYQSALTNSTVVNNAENAVAQLVQTNYGVTLSTNAFLTTSFTPGQPGADSDLDNLQTAGAITSDGQPADSLSTAALTAGQSTPISGSGGSNPTGGTGGTGGAGGTGT